MPEVFEFADQKTDKAVIKVIGVGGGGGNTINQMVNGGIEGVDFICANTDAQHLERCDADVLVQLGMNVTRGLGAGADPAIGRQAAEEDRDRIRESIEGADMLFITCGMGGGTGTGAAPVIAQVARECGALTVAVVTRPFFFEGRKRLRQAEEGVEFLTQNVDTLITIPNQRLVSMASDRTTMKEAFRMADDELWSQSNGLMGQASLSFAEKVRQARQLDLQSALARLRAQAEDLEDQPGPVDHLARELFLQRALLNRGERAVDDDQLGLGQFGLGADLFDLPRPEQRGGPHVADRLDIAFRYLDPDRVREADRLGEALLGRQVVDLAANVGADDERARTARHLALQVIFENLGRSCQSSSS